MSRQLRLDFPGAIWHITSRGNEKRDIVRDDRDRRQFVHLLGKAVVEYGWMLHAWVLMRNHYHLLLETPTIGLSKGVKDLNQTYVQYFNARHERVGHLFQGRFKSILVEREGHLLELVRYIVLNPVRCGAVRFASQYEWSNYRATAGIGRIPPWLHVDWTLSCFRNGQVSAEEEYRRFVADARGASYNPWESLLGQIYLGGETFREEMQAHVDAQKRSRQHPKAQREVIRRPSMETLTTFVSDVFLLPADDLRRRRDRLAAKALTLVARGKGWSLVSVGRWLGVTAPAVSKMEKGGRELYDCDRRFREKVDQVRYRSET